MLNLVYFMLCETIGYQNKKLYKKEEQDRSYWVLKIFITLEVNHSPTKTKISEKTINNNQTILPNIKWE